VRPEFPALEQHPRPAADRCAATEPLSVQQFRPVQPARQVVLAIRSVRLLGRPRSVASSARQDAAVAPSSCFRQAEGQLSAVLSEPAWWQAPAAV